MNEFKEYTAKTVDDAITEACENLSVTSDRLDYEVVSQGSNGFFGMGAKAAVIRARIKEEIENKENNTINVVKENKETKTQTNTNLNVDKICEDAKKFLTDVFHSMNMPVVIDISFDEKNEILNIDLSGEDMGVLIGKRGQTLDSLQYLVSLVVNRETDRYVHVKVDTENYRQRRKATLENLARNIAYKVKKTRRSVSLEPMNPYERRIIHSALQQDRFVTTHSEGEEPYRRVVVTLKK